MKNIATVVTSPYFIKYMIEGIKSGNVEKIQNLKNHTDTMLELIRKDIDWQKTFNIVIPADIEKNYAVKLGFICVCYSKMIMSLKETILKLKKSKRDVLEHEILLKEYQAYYNYYVKILPVIKQERI